MRMVAEFTRTALRLLTGLVVGMSLAFPSFADEVTGSPVLDELFAELKKASDPITAHAIDQQIWMIWTVPPDPVLAGRMNEVMSARGMGDPVEAIALLDKLVVDYPGYAEAWNQRATMYYVIGNFEASIADCAKVLELEPRHFGALSGRALMYLQQGKRALALKDMAAAMEIHPFLNERELFPELKQKEEMTRI
jgi:tetratricopeptide (TPR) repeat protein